MPNLRAHGAREAWTRGKQMGTHIRKNFHTSPYVQSRIGLTRMNGGIQPRAALKAS
jgi:hypothetical protein